MSAIQSNLASILFPYPSSSAVAHGAGCNCSSCSANGSCGGSSGTGSASGSSTSAQGAGGAATSSQTSSASTGLDASGKPLSASQQGEVDALKKTDAAVRRHEQAHLSAAGGYARSGIVLNYKVGPDGKEYAVGGHVDIDTSPVKGNPAATIAKMQTVQRAALAPADPSGQDVRVAAEAGQEANQARAQEVQQQLQAAGNGSPGTTATTGAATSNIDAGGAVTSASASPKNRKAGGLNLSIQAQYAKSSPSASNSASDSNFSGMLLDVVG